MKQPLTISERARRQRRIDEWCTTAFFVVAVIVVIGASAIIGETITRDARPLRTHTTEGIRK